MKKKISFTLACLMVLTLCLTLGVGAEHDLADSISLPQALILGHTYDLQFADTKLSVNGTACEGTFVAEGSRTELVYTDASGAQVGTYSLPVIDTNNSADHCAYFYDPTGAVSVKENANDITLSFSKDSQVAFLNDLNGDSFSINLGVAEDVSNYSAVTLKLTDTADARNSLTFRLDPTAKTVSLQKQTTKLENAGTTLQIKFKNTLQRLYVGDVSVLTCTVNDNGDAFQGFAGSVYMTLGFEGVTGSSQVTVTRLCNQPMGHKDSAAVDSTEPVIVVTSQLSSKLNMGDTFTIPSFTAFDVFSDVVKTSISVELPDGSTATESFTVSQYGRYKLTLTADDSFGNRAKTTRTIFVNDDIAPQLQVNSMKKTSYKVGNAVTFPTYTASDNLDVYYVDVILILPNSEVRLLTHDASGEVTYCLTDTSLYPASFCKNETSFKAEQKGTYTLRYVAYDDQFNKTVQELTFTVK